MSGCSPLMSHSCPKLGSFCTLLPRMHHMVSFLLFISLRLVTSLAPHLAGYGRCFSFVCNFFSNPVFSGYISKT
ncbi:hypothetical protein EDB86DRAFT_2880377 [Lactarius hatsudake]|nr:hypothetical protein EDB86DRAFT_2880377 [Lactarius hatsudake]